MDNLLSNLTPNSTVAFILQTPHPLDDQALVKRKQIIKLADMDFNQALIDSPDFEAEIEDSMRFWAYDKVDWHIYYNDDFERLTESSLLTLDLYFGKDKVHSFEVSVGQYFHNCGEYHGYNGLAGLTADAFNSLLSEYTGQVIYDYYRCYYVFDDLLPDVPEFTQNNDAAQAAA